MTSIFLDISGSVNNSLHYWENVKNIYNKHKDDISDFYVWDNGVKKHDRTTFIAYINSMRGYGGTEPSKIINCIKTNKIKHIILITDGEVGDDEVSRTDKLLDNYKLEKSICYIIANTVYSKPNMSVTCPFTRNCSSKVYKKYYNEEMTEEISFTQDDFKILDELDTISLDNFLEKYNLLENLIIAKNMGKESNVPLKNQIVIMKNRLVKELSSKMASTSDYSKIRDYLKANDLTTALNIIKTMTDEYFGESLTGELEKKISHLINLCGDLRGKYNINQIKSNRLTYAPVVEKATDILQVEVNNLTSHPIECPVIYDEDIPQIMIKKGEPILMDVDKNIVEDITNCPLRILNYREIKEKFKSRIGQYIGVKYTKYLESNPFTREELLGTIPLGTCKEHVDVGNYTIAKLMTGGKLLGNLNMYYAVIWYLIKEDEIEYLKDIKINTNEHLMYRFINSNTNASLSGLAQFVSTKLPTDIAVWYVVNSGWLNQPTDRDTLRFHIFNIKPLMDIVELFGYPIEPNTENHINRTQIMMQMLSYVKNVDNNKKLDFYNRVKCLYQNGVFININHIGDDVKEHQKIVSIVPIDGPASESQINKIYNTFPSNYKKCSEDELVYLASLVNPNKSASDIKLEYNFEPLTLKEEINWPYELNEYEEALIPICPYTLRPFYIMKDKTWRECVEEEFKFPADKLFKGCKYFGQFMVDYKRKPNIDEYLTYVYNRYIISNHITTLPYQVYNFTIDIIKSYNKIQVSNENYELIKKTYNNSVSIVDRIKKENEYKIVNNLTI